MAGFLRKTAAFLGLVADDELVDYDDSEEFSEPIYRSDKKVERSTVTKIRPVEADDGPQITDISRIVTVHPRNYNEARTIGEHFRDGDPVIMNLSDMDDDDAKRLVDFGAGLIFGLRGTIERVTSKVFLLSPNNVQVAAEDKERIKGGFFNQS